MRSNFIWFALLALGLILLLMPSLEGGGTGIVKGARSPRSLFFVKSRIRRRRLDLGRKNNVVNTDVLKQVKRHRRGMFKF